jgi:hypothetical protein
MASAPPDLLLTADEAPDYGISHAYLDAFETDNPGVLATKLSAVSGEALGYMKGGGGIVLPLTAWGDVTRQKVADLLIYELKSYGGMASGDASVGDQNIILRAQAARDWFKELGMGTAEDPDLVDSSDDGEAGPTSIECSSDETRGW